MAKKDYKKQTSNQKKIIIVLITIILLLVGYIFLSKSEKIKSNGFDFSNTISTIKNNVKDVLGEDSEPITPVEGAMRVHVIDVGQGSSTLIENGKHAILIDAGDTGKGFIVADYVKKLGIEEIDLMIATHPHADHIGGMDEFMQKVNVKEIVMPVLSKTLTPTSKAYFDLLTEIDKQNKTITPSNTGAVFDYDGLRLTILGPATAFDNLNDMSVISKIEYGTNSVIVSGDANKQAERKAMTNTKTNLKSDILILGHHGSNTSSAEEFVLEIDPKYVAASLGKDNSYGHPHKEVVELMKRLQIPMYRTDEKGNIVFVCDGENITVECEK